MKIDKNTTFIEAMQYMQTFKLTEEQIEPLYEAARKIAIPDKLKVNYNTLIFGKLAKIQKFTSSKQFFLDAPKLLLLRDKGEKEPNVIYKIREYLFFRKLLKRPAVEVFAFILDMKKNFERIAMLFSRLDHSHTKEEEAAGVSDIKGSMHTIADWYAQRMHITDVSSVYLIPWSIIYEAMKIDKQNNDFKRRMYAQMTKKK